MQESINFATYFRPQTYSEVVGQDIPKSVLKKVAMTDGISVRSIFLKGAFGSGKSTLCRIFAKSMNCSQFKKTGEVCNECDSCKEVNAKNSQLYYEFDSATVGNVEYIRNLQEQLSYVPNGRRVVVFDEIHAASKAALNAMLKMVEEGVPNTVFVFASTEDILPTIKSRSLCLDITTIPMDLIKQRVKQVAEMANVSITDEALTNIALKSGGHMRDAMSLLQLYSLCGDEGLKTSYSLVYKFFGKCLSKKKTDAEALLIEILKYPMVDIKSSIYNFIRNAYLADSTSSLFKIQQSGTINKVFQFFFTPVAQAAIKDEFGLELLLRNFMDKLCR